MALIPRINEEFYGLRDLVRKLLFGYRGAGVNSSQMNGNQFVARLMRLVLSIQVGFEPSLPSFPDLFAEGSVGQEGLADSLGDDFPAKKRKKVL